MRIQTKPIDHRLVRKCVRLVTTSLKASRKVSEAYYIYINLESTPAVFPLPTPADLTKRLQASDTCLRARQPSHRPRPRPMVATTQ